jgi:Fur family ferric uptake transcriptional regulator
MTNQRRVILEIVKMTDSHPTADEIYESVRKRLPRISMGTVYRNLDVLASCGIIKKLDPGRTQMRFDGNTQEHYHLTCMRCGRIEDLSFKPSDDPLENLENLLGNLTKYGVFGHKLEFIGLCNGCLKEGYAFPEDISENQMQKGGNSWAL